MRRHVVFRHALVQTSAFVGACRMHQGGCRVLHILLASSPGPATGLAAWRARPLLCSSSSSIGSSRCLANYLLDSPAGRISRFWAQMQRARTDSQLHLACLPNTWPACLQRLSQWSIAMLACMPCSIPPHMMDAGRPVPSS